MAQQEIKRCPNSSSLETRIIYSGFASHLKRILREGESGAFPNLIPNNIPKMTSTDSVIPTLANPLPIPPRSPVRQRRPSIVSHERSIPVGLAILVDLSGILSRDAGAAEFDIVRDGDGSRTGFGFHGCHSVFLVDWLRDSFPSFFRLGVSSFERVRDDARLKSDLRSVAYPLPGGECYKSIFGFVFPFPDE